MTRLSEIKNLLHAQLDTFDDKEILDGISIGVCIDDDHNQAWGLDTNGKTIEEVIKEIDSAVVLFDLHYPYPVECTELVED